MTKERLAEILKELDHADVYRVMHDTLWELKEEVEKLIDELAVEKELADRYRGLLD